MCMHKKELNKISFKLYYKDHLGNIRAVMDGASGTITQAQGFDAWGDICRTYSTTDTTVNKFTGKERDQETGYDYFGARYYDSRIYRWLQIEPLYDKYLQFSPYQYGLLNPMKLVDADGNDVIVTIEGNVITVTMIMNYKTEGIGGHIFNTVEKENILIKYLNDAEDEWSEAAREYKDNGYTLKFNFEFKENSVVNFDDIPEGENFAYYDEKGNEPGIVEGNKMKIVPIITFDLFGTHIKVSPSYTGSHEFGHIIGLSHIGPKGSKEQLESDNIMGYSKDRKPPNIEDVRKFMKQVDFKKSRQIIKGDINIY
jgi:RHS repeat-associated protein